jgi:NAD-dependent SIR2 family protein deacetylase
LFRLTHLDDTRRGGTSGNTVRVSRASFSIARSSGFYPFNSQEEKWAYWAKHISINRYEEHATELYHDLFHLISGKEYFVPTTNVEGQFRKAGFPAKRVFAVQGDYGYFQCAKGCHDRLYYNEKQVAEMLRRTEDCKIPSDLVPKCPVCSGGMDVYVHKNQYFVREKNWHDSQERYMNFLRACEGKRLVLLELGVGFNTPGIIRFPFETLVHTNPKAVLIRANRDHPHGMDENASRAIAFTEDMARLVRAIQEQGETGSAENTRGG